ncbi:uncharacterized protein LOC132732939 [Ruditapes philippinarum]|uniref:uncharacterized protein LOC132732939 n=1 Tax=Ruditapes philippinarum TaxID=129788 RepID=UPI00295BDCAD|nr:uncharacterized protein LOC132732939 [Ruditapes philippinarum]
MELDIIVNKSHKTPSRPETYRALIDKDETKRWNKNIPFEIGDGIDDLQELTIQRAIRKWEKYSCISFYNDKQIFNRLVFKRGYNNLCASEVGMQQGPQIINLGNSCFKQEIVIHEIGHALGFYHEHNRWDRDNYIKINYENIEPGYNRSFVKEKEENADYDHDYDYLSIMHYGQNFFSKNDSGKLTITIETTDPKFQSRIGKVKRPSFQDYKTVNAMYKCADNCDNDECPKDGFKGKQCQCYCKGNADGTRVKLCYETQECPKPLINKYLFDVWNKEKTRLINMTRTSFPDKTVLKLVSTNWNCSVDSQFRCDGDKWKETMSECPIALDIEMTDGIESVVEVILNDEHRGYICDDDWDDNDATVACKMLGYTKGLAFFPKAKEVNESLPILLDNVQCSGKELSLSDCKHNGWGNHNCDYSEVVSVKCFDDSFTNHINLTTNITCGTIKMHNHNSKRKKTTSKGNWWLGGRKGYASMASEYSTKETWTDAKLVWWYNYQ